MRPYELTFIIAPDVDEQGITAIVDQVKGWITAANGTHTKTDTWGRRRLEYPIARFNEGYYVFLNFDSEPAALTELDRNLRLEQKVIRHLVIRADV
ncbi:MAG TPA: 30S ribosomal protein S6 [Aggregatilineales bacterium]|nr:30S ribosomal protein S6 [Anaerolineales bacterium]HRE47479.1 30S ribosomal protein S6 [Aggregatilineales bacterium]